MGDFVGFDGLTSSVGMQAVKFAGEAALKALSDFSPPAGPAGNDFDLVGLPLFLFITAMVVKAVGPVPGSRQWFAQRDFISCTASRFSRILGSTPLCLLESLYPHCVRPLTGRGKRNTDAGRKREDGWVAVYIEFMVSLDSLFRAAAPRFRVQLHDWCGDDSAFPLGATLDLEVLSNCDVAAALLAGKRTQRHCGYDITISDPIPLIGPECEVPKAPEDGTTLLARLASRGYYCKDTPAGKVVGGVEAKTVMSEEEFKEVKAGKVIARYFKQVCFPPGSPPCFAVSCACVCTGHGSDEGVGSAVGGHGVWL